MLVKNISASTMTQLLSQSSGRFTAGKKLTTVKLVSLMRYYTLLQDTKRNNDIGKTSTKQTDTQTDT